MVCKDEARTCAGLPDNTTRLQRDIKGGSRNKVTQGRRYRGYGINLSMGFAVPPVKAFANNAAFTNKYRADNRVWRGETQPQSCKVKASLHEYFISIHKARRIRNTTRTKIPQYGFKSIQNKDKPYRSIRKGCTNSQNSILNPLFKKSLLFKIKNLSKMKFSFFRPDFMLLLQRNVVPGFVYFL